MGKPNDDIFYKVSGENTDGMKLMLELVVVIAAHLDSEKTMEILEKNGVKVEYFLK